jgi:broad-specificity NMP kinase
MAKKNQQPEIEKEVIKHIAVAGNIGSGKTTLTDLLAKHYNWEARFEDVESNPYLNDFYADMPRWSFNLQIYRPQLILILFRGTGILEMEIPPIYRTQYMII